jgi:hypothetical protein
MNGRLIGLTQVRMAKAGVAHAPGTAIPNADVAAESSSVAAGGRLYLRGGKRITCYDLRKSPPADSAKPMKIEAVAGDDVDR